ncbi:MAG TPA: PKD domain-containing protein [Phycisphaerae bacterium]|nr:PKD domain-containing protein [Phycisphaerae bacterium]
MSVKRSSLVGICSVALFCLAAPAAAVDGIVVTARFEKDGLGDIHDSSTPGVLMRHDVKDDRPAGSRVLHDGGVGGMCIGPFGRRVAFTKPDGTIAVVGIEGGAVRDVGRFVGDEKPQEAKKPERPVATGLQWPAGDGGKWVYYMDGRDRGQNNTLRRVHVETKEDQRVVRFNRSAGGGFALSRDATARSGRYVVRTDNYTLAAYDLAAGDGDLYAVPQYVPGCGNSISPDGSLFTANGGWHIDCSLIDMNARRQGGFRVNQWAGDPTAGVTDRRKIEWAWQHHRWSVNAMGWIVATQGRLKVPSSHAVFSTDAVLYDWVNQRQINVTRNQPGRFDRAGGFWQTGVEDAFLGYHQGEAPLTVSFADPRIEGDWRWDFGDGTKPAAGPTARHTFQAEGAYTVRATREGRAFEAQVTVRKRLPPAATCHVVDRRCLLVEFDEPVDAAQAVVGMTNNVRVARWALDPAGRRMVVHLDRPLAGGEQLRLKNIRDLAQVPNLVREVQLPLAVPDWPGDRRDLVFLWADGRAFNAVYDAEADMVRRLHVTPDRGAAGLDRFRRMRLAGGMLDTGFFSQGRGQEQFGPLVRADAFTLEATIQPADLTQDRGEFPARIVCCSAWHEWDWNFLLGQQRDRLLFSVRTTDNFLSKEGKPITAGLHGRAPLIEIARLRDTRPLHVIVSYEPGWLAVYLDGERVLETGSVTGSLMQWGYGELCFGDSHNGGRHAWLGRLEGVAIYKRFCHPPEARRNFQAVRRKLLARKTPPQIEVEAALAAKSDAPDPARIAPYREALMVNEYRVTKVLRAEKGGSAAVAVKAGQAVRVAQWGILEGRTTTVAEAKVGQARRMTLEAYDAHPDRLDRIVTSDTLDLDPDATMLYEPEPPL